jgi:ankyrin repeat protein
MLLNIDQESVEDARRILTLLCCAKRPLTLPELIEGVAVELGDDPRLNPDGRLPDEDEIRRVCPGFIEVDAQPDGKTITVRIAHYSVQEYLESGRILHPKVANFSVKMREAHTEVACVCLTYLLSMARGSSAEYPLALYAAERWHEHYHDGNKGTHLVERQAIRLFRSTEGEFENWLRNRNRGAFWELGGNIRHPPSRVYYAALLGLDIVISGLLSVKPFGGRSSGLNPLEVSALVNGRGGYYGNPLQVASYSGNEKVVRLLLDNNADVNAQGGFHGNALQAASYRGYDEIVRLLLDKKADVNAQGGECGNALQAASSRGHEKVVRLLLDKNANVNARSRRGHGYTSLYTYINGDDNAQGGHYGNALQAASYNGNEKVVQLLLDRNANINVRGGYYGNALQAASISGYEKVVQLLLDKNADVNAQGGKYGNALQAASYRGYDEIVRLLLDKKADVNAQGGECGNALQAASSRGHEKVVQLLLDKNADVNAQGGEYGNALQEASSRGHEKVVQLLPNKDTNINA